MHALNQWRARSTVDPPRPISNRVVKRRSAEGTGGLPAGRVGPRAIHTTGEGKRTKAKGKAEMFTFYLLPSHSTRRGAVAARRAHNPKVGGSNPPAATTKKSRVTTKQVVTRLFYARRKPALGKHTTAQTIRRPLKLFCHGTIRL